MSLDVWVERSAVVVGDVVYALVRVTNASSEQVTYVGNCPSFARVAVETRPPADTARRVKQLGRMEPPDWLQSATAAGPFALPILHECAPSGAKAVIEPGGAREATLGWIVEATHPYWADDPTVVAALFKGSLEQARRVKPLDLQVDVPIELLGR